MKLLIKLNHFSAWILLGGIILYFASGFGMTKGLIDAQLAYSIHHDILPYVILAALIFHAGFGIRAAFMRWRIWNKGGKILLFPILAGFLGLFIWVEFFYSKTIINPTTQEQTQEPNTQTQEPDTQTQEPGTNTQTQGPGTVPALPTVLNAQEVAKHNLASDCWLIISGKVYNLTSYINSHPGGRGNIIQNCGKDGTFAFDTKYESEPHSGYAASLLNNYLLGNLGQTIYLQK